MVDHQVVDNSEAMTEVIPGAAGHAGRIAAGTTVDH
jgi:hypothetical protein